ncbi:MAG: hypothetical protein KatS3mg114_0114 [Planctomycetaceae bacterium]|nr:MAG: hypothetical protein KatS3mg114_0114 [Planctomycetaceae bacterium]
MHTFRLAVATRCWSSPLVEVLPQIFALGIKGIQLDVRHEFPPESLGETGRRDFLHRLREHGLQVATTVFPLKYPLASEYQLERRLEAIQRAMVFSYQLGARVLCMRPGVLPEQLDSREGRHWQEVLNDLARYGNHVGVTLAVAPTLERGQKLEIFLQWLKGVQTGPVGVDVDPAALVQGGASVLDTVKQWYGLVQHVQLRDAVKLLVGGTEEVPLGEGTVPWLELLALLSEMEYSGWLTASRAAGENPSRDVEHAIECIQRWLHGG